MLWSCLVCYYPWIELAMASLCTLIMDTACWINMRGRVHGWLKDCLPIVLRRDWKLIAGLKWECGLSFQMTAPRICTQFVSHMAVRRRVWAKAALFDRMGKSIVRNYDSKQNWLNRQVGWWCRKGGAFWACAINFIPKSLFTDAIVCGGQKLLGRLPVAHLFGTDCAGSEGADTWQKARPDDSTVIDVAAMLKAHSCGEHRYGNVREPPPESGRMAFYKLTSLKILLVTGPLQSHDVTWPSARSEMMHSVSNQWFGLYIKAQSMLW